MSIEGRLKFIRDSLGCSQREMSKMVGSSYSAWQSYESGTSVPGGRVLERLALLGFNVNWILTGEGEICPNGQKRFSQKDKDEGFYALFSEYLEKCIDVALHRHEIRMLGGPGSPIENIYQWLYEFWKGASDQEKTWLIINFRKAFPEFQKWEKEKAEKQEKYEERY